MINNTIDIEIHIGDNTHHHDQSIQWVSLNPIKRIVSNTAKEILPPEDDLLIFIQFSCGGQGDPTLTSF